MRLSLVLTAALGFWAVTGHTVAVAAEATASVAVTLSAGDHTLKFAPPPGVCLLDRATDPADSSFLERLAQSFTNSAALAAVFADCTTLNEWRRGKLNALERYGLILVPLRGGSVKPLQGVARSGFLDAIEVDSPAGDWAKARDAANATASLPDTGTSPPTTSVRDAAGVYLPSVARLRLGDGGTGKRVVRASVEGFSEIATLPVTVTVYQPWNDQALDSLLSTDQAIVASLVASNPETTPDGNASATAATSAPGPSKFRDYGVPLIIGLVAGGLVTRIIRWRRASPKAKPRTPTDTL